MQRIFLSLVTGILLTGCVSVHKARHTPSPEKRILNIDKPSFNHLKSTRQPHDLNMFFGSSFAHDADYYRAITSYRKARYLSQDPNKIIECDYNILLSYYLAGQYNAALTHYFSSSLPKNSEHNYARDSAIILYDSSQYVGNQALANQSIEYLNNTDPHAFYQMSVYNAFLTQDIEYAKTLSSSQSTLYKEFDGFLDTYNKIKYNPDHAARLALFPGVGYMYLNQRSSAFTSVVVNALFIWATKELYDQEMYAATALCASLEFGWYFGGIIGSRIAAEEKNNVIYNNMLDQFISDNQLYPTNLLKHVF
ncbi:hypothetical protein N9N03_01450 [Chlamydiia bacterium]|jgi:hypothetical protein|nr:hypothetical protein [Chlamydiia bacterium]